MYLVGKSLNTTLQNGQNYEDANSLSYKVYEHKCNFEGYLENHNFIGVAYNSSIDKKLPSNIFFEYFKGFDVKNIKQIPKGFIVKKIPAKKYLKFTTLACKSEYQKTLDYIFGHVILNEDLALSDEDVNLIEIFRFDIRINDTICVELYVPLK